MLKGIGTYGIIKNINRIIHTYGVITPGIPFFLPVKFLSYTKMTPIDSINEEITMRRVIQGYMIMIKIRIEEKLETALSSLLYQKLLHNWMVEA